MPLSLDYVHNYFFILETWSTSAGGFIEIDFLELNL